MLHTVTTTSTYSKAKVKLFYILGQKIIEFFGVPLSTDRVGSPVLANEPQEKSDRTAQEIREIRVKLESLIAAV